MKVARVGGRGPWGLVVAGVSLGLGLAAGGCSAPGRAAVCDWDALGVEAPNGFRSDESEPGPAAQGADDSSSPESYLDAARALRTHGETEGALTVLEHGLALHPEDPRLLGLRGELRCDSGYHRAAERDFLEAIDMQPDNAELWRLLGETRLALELPASANQALRRCDALSPNDPETVALLAKASWDCGQLEKAWLLYKEALAHPETADIELLVEGGSLFSTAKIQERHPEDRALAFGWLYRALTRDPQMARAHYVRGVLFEGENRTENALAAYRSAIEADPDCPGVNTRLALLLTSQGELTEAKQFADEALLRERNDDLRRVLQEIARS